MKNTLLIISIISFQIAFSQSKEKKYLMFDSSSESSYEYEVGNGNKEARKIFVKEFKENGDIVFYIKDNMFRYSKKLNSIDSCIIGYLKNIEFSNLKSLEESVNKNNPIYPYKVYPNLYLVEKINDSIILKYKVKWEFYIE